MKKIEIVNDLEYMSKEVERAIETSIKNQLNMRWIEDIFDITEKNNANLKINPELLKNLK